MYYGTCCIVYIIRFIGCSQRYLFSVFLLTLRARAIYVCARFLFCHDACIFCHDACIFCHFLRFILSVRLNVGYVRLCRPRGSGESVPALSVFIMLSLESISFSVLLNSLRQNMRKPALLFLFKRKESPRQCPRSDNSSRLGAPRLGL